MRQNNTYKEYMYSKLKKNRENKRRKMYVIISLFLLFCSILVGLCFFYRSTNTNILNMLSGKLDTNVVHDEELVEDMYHFNVQNNSTTKFTNDINLTVSSESDISYIPLTLVLENTTTNKTTTLTPSKISKNELVYNFNEIIKPDAKNTDYVFKIVANDESANVINYLFHFDVCCKTGNFGYKQGYNFEFNRIGEPEIFTYEINKDRTVSITGLTDDYISKLQNGTETGFTIPTLYHNLPVYSVKENAFTSLPVNYTVAFDEGVEVIEDNVFSKDTMRNTDIILPQSLRSLGSNNFTGMKLDNVEVNSNIDCNSPFENSTIKNITINNTSIIPNTVFNNVYSIENMNLSDEITTIGNNAFSNIDTMFDIFSLPDNILSIGNEAFMNTNIKTMELNKTVNIGARAFKNSSIVDLNIPTNVETINIDAFNSSKITNLTMNDLPTMNLNNKKSVFTDAVIDNLNLNNINTIPSYTFNYTNSINHLNIGEKLTSVDNNAFSNINYVGNFTYNNTITKWKDVFYNTGLDSLVIENGIEALPDSAFMNTKSINSIDFGELTSISRKCFANIDMSKCDVVFPEALTKIGQQSFKDSSLNSVFINKNMSNNSASDTSFENASIKTITFEDGMTQTPEYLFQNLNSVNEINFPSSLTSLGSFCFNGADLSNVEVIEVPDNVTNIGVAVFENCNTVKKLILPSSISSIGINGGWSSPFVGTTFNTIEFKYGTTTLINEMFRYGVTINNLILPETVTSIGQSVFHKSRVDNIVGWDNVTFIGYCAFEEADLSKNTSFNLPKQLRELSGYAFKNVDFSKDAVITIPKTLTKCADWDAPSFENTTFYHLKFEDGLTSLPSRLFQNCNINDPDFTLKDTTITNIPGFLFVNTNISDCTNFDLPNNLIDLGSCSFYNITFSKNTVITIPKSLKNTSNEWDNPTFNGCTFYHLQFEDGLTTLPVRIFQDCTIADPTFTLKNTTITRINSNAFQNTDLTACINFDLPKNLVSLDSSIFNNTKFNKDTVITIPKTLKTCGNWDNPSFQGCTFNHLKIEYGMTTLPERIFQDCTIADSTFTLKDTTITYIKYGAFQNTNLTTCINFDLPKNLVSLDGCIFYNVKFNQDTVITIPKTLTNPTTDYENPSFKGCTFYHLKFEDGITTLPERIFQDCTIADPTFTLKDTAITSIKFAAFYKSDLSACTKFELPNNIVSLEGYSFANIKLSDIYIYNKTVNIDENAFNESKTIIHGYYGSTAETFAETKNLTFEPLDDLTPLFTYTTNDDGSITITGIDTSADVYSKLKDKFVIPKKLGDKTITSISDGLFENNTDIKTVSIKASITKIPNNCFKNCINLTSVEYPDSVVEFGNSAFENTGITTMKISSNIEKIGDNAIDTTVSISCKKNSAAYEYAMKNGNPLVTINYANLLNINNGTITGFNTNNEEYTEFDGVLDIPSTINGQTVTSINGDAFRGNKKITSVNIPSTITTIGGYAFYDCSNLKELTFDEGEANTLFIDWHSFDNTSIEGTIIFPARVKDIHCEAFFNTKITDAWFYNSNQEFEGGYRVIPTTATVHGYTNSTAQNYSNNFGNTFVEITE